MSTCPCANPGLLTRERETKKETEKETKGYSPEKERQETKGDKERDMERDRGLLNREEETETKKET